MHNSKSGLLWASSYWQVQFSFGQVGLYMIIMNISSFIIFVLKPWHLSSDNTYLSVPK